MSVAAFINTPLSYFSIPIIWLSAFFLVRMRVDLVEAKIGWDYLVGAPENLERLKKDSADKEFVNRVLHIERAHQNTLEAFPLWAVAVIVGNAAGMSNRTLNICSALYVGGRFLYVYLFINQKTFKQSRTRSLSWALTTLIPLYVLFHSAIIRSRWTN
ncbi:hypothetical protein EXIGLDRAFT_717792 [Exidia glandulosa HHB12029]|uniref:Membrane-associated proteins in eicosanoid and glutathione metabolism n=1 Tax=Exidia glandulosa HHB12029 TaxID=1314781 RepID=A0A165I5V5_EXIGL|nr:hypothetical protein EXIGLDRAFT_717792 [Exidia glandulosa HHB12029]